MGQSVSYLQHLIRAWKTIEWRAVHLAAAAGCPAEPVKMNSGWHAQMATSAWTLVIDWTGWPPSRHVHLPHWALGLDSSDSPGLMSNMLWHGIGACTAG